MYREEKRQGGISPVWLITSQVIDALWILSALATKEQNLGKGPGKF